MPDSATLEMPDQGGGGKGVPGWVMVVGAVAGVVGLVLLLKNQGGGTTAAGTSINAALGSIQETQMNTLGQVTQAESMINASNNLAQERSLMSLWASNQVVWAASEGSTIEQLKRSGGSQAEIDQYTKDMNERLNNALTVWKEMGGIWPNQPGINGPTINPGAENQLVGNTSPHYLSTLAGSY